MRWYKLIAPAAVGITVGTIIGKKVKDQWLVPEVALKRAKEVFKQDGPISGSWIIMEKENYSKSDENLLVYRGGVTRNVDGETTQYEFFVDATNGKLIESSKIG
ncbi:peptidase M4 [Halalkalibacillus sediminis]|uniref:Peptidase M4 n=1 Tax=Halalkalibacillus sediminis TaxID=2018042 RepID=A0A2I0QYE0_9BACI|nr:PepSY domain-containing protein [Halalkalibacillus sediminis]PKR79329.1 peptidase M4 [Halalkalibacillus sediminis]